MSSSLSVTFVPATFASVRAGTVASSFTGNVCGHVHAKPTLGLTTGFASKRVRVTMSGTDDGEAEEDKPLLPSDLDEGLEKIPGFTDFSELLNGRVAMVGFVTALAIELVTGRGLISIVSDMMGGGGGV